MSVTKLIHQVETVLAGELDSSRLSTLKMTLTEKIKTLSTLDDEIANLLEDEGALAEDIEQSDEYKQKIYAVIVSIDKAIAPAPPTGPAHALYVLLRVTTLYPPMLPLELGFPS